jgi:hypothetical protein
VHSHVLILALFFAPPPAPRSLTEIQHVLLGAWTGTLEYRDFSEPATSTKRVKLPTWLTIESSGADLRFRYVYDDGPAKTVTDTEIIRIDSGAARYQVLGPEGTAKESYAIEGLATLREGKGTLVLTGPGTENGAPVDARTTFRIGRNILVITRETSPHGEPMIFRHTYTLVRSAPPSAPSQTAP